MSREARGPGTQGLMIAAGLAVEQRSASSDQQRFGGGSPETEARKPLVSSD